jgi:DNA-binding response OmpR family regulator
LLVLGPLEEMLQRRGSDHSDFLVAPPLRTDEILLRAFHLLTSTRRSAAGATPAVLAVDDDATTNAIVRAVVTRSGMTCHIATNGRQALESARALKPSAIVLDVNMPYIDGFEVLTTLRNDPETAEIPIVMLTSVQQESDIVRGFGLGADDYVVKPFNPMELVARIKRLVRKG